MDAYLYLALVPVMSVFVFLLLAHLHSFVVIYRTLRRLRSADWYAHTRQAPHITRHARCCSLRFGRSARTRRLSWWARACCRWRRRCWSTACTPLRPAAPAIANGREAGRPRSPASSAAAAPPPTRHVTDALARACACVCAGCQHDPDMTTQSDLIIHM
jgi:hypothetical protein